MFDLNKFKSNPYKYVDGISVSELEQILTYLSDKYYNDGKSVVSDKIYDGLITMLEERDGTNKLLSNIGAKTKRSVKLPIYVGSLDKIKPDSGELGKFISAYSGPYVVSDKLDGISCICVRTNFGTKLYTRGDGYYGSDISHISKYILYNDTKKDCCIKLDKFNIGEIVRGELIISKKKFDKISNEFENARNAVSGVVNAKKINKKVMELIEFVTYNIYVPKKDKNSVLRISEQLHKLKDIGFNVVTYDILDNISNDVLSSYLVTRRKNSKYNIDGIVVVDDAAPYEVINDFPKHAFAFKSILTNDMAEVQVKEVEWNPSKDGYIKPKIKIHPVKLSGVKISSLTGFNAKYIVDNKIGAGSILKITRSGDVIPHIVDIIEPSSYGNAQLPDFPFVWTNTGVDIVIDDKDDNECVKIKRIVHFFKKIGVKNIDEKIVEKMVINKYDSIYKILSTDPTDFAKIDGIGINLIKKIFNNIHERLNTIDIITFMSASQCFGRGIGSKKIKKILEIYPNVLECTDIKKTKNDLLKINGIDDVTAEQFVDGISNFNKFYDEIKKSMSINNNSFFIGKSIDLKESDVLKNHVVVFTGIRDKKLETAVERNGGRVSTNVSSKTTILVCKDKNSASSKLQDAKRMGINIYDIDEFVKKFDMK